MSVAPGTRVGPYEVVSLIGAGGMGEVYLARDLKLKREVAVKVLPDGLAHDPGRLARFQREAELLATLNHPNIGTVYGLEESSGAPAMIMELVPGPTLADRITQGPLPLDEALAIANQIADALEAAHDKGVIHRDLKPANIKLAPDGIVKVLDFGLAKIFEGTPAGSAISMSPTLSLHATSAGLVLGTAAYMSPEQARGRAVDKRTDVWAYGCVVFEMLTGTRAFDGEDVTETLGAVIHKAPAWNRLPADTPAAVRTALERCIEKDLKRRLRDIGDAKLALAGAFETRVEVPPVSGTMSGAAAARERRRMWMRTAASVTIGVVLTAAVAWAYVRFTAQPRLPVKFGIVPPPSQPLLLQGNDRDIAIAPDGSYIVYRAGGPQSQTSQLFVRAIGQIEARPLVAAADGGVRSPFISPDGQWVGFFAGDGTIKKVSINGGSPISLCTFMGLPRGASWGRDDTIVFATNNPETGLLRVSSAGGEPTVLTRAKPGDVTDHWFPTFLPDGRNLLYTVAVGQPATVQIAILDLTSGQTKILLPGGSHAEYVEGGYLLYAAAGTLRAVRFDKDRLEPLGAPVPVLEQVTTAASTFAANYALSRNGTLVFVPGSVTETQFKRALVWVDRKGREEEIKAPYRAYTYARLSPEGSRIALDIRDEEDDIWVWDLVRRTLTRLTTDPGLDRSPVWTPDGKRIVYSSQADRTGSNLFWKGADGVGPSQQLTKGARIQFPTSVSPDGRRVLYRENERDAEAGASTDIWMTTLDGQSTPEALIRTTFSERNAEVSHDGRWVAYQSEESGQSQIYISPFPAVNSGRVTISTAGGHRPAWARGDRELFYLDAKNLLTVVPIETDGAAIRPGQPARVLDRAYAVLQAGRNYDVSADGQRFLMIKESSDGEIAEQVDATPASMIVVLNWLDELKRLVPER